MKMISGKYSEQEINNINEIEQQLNRDSQYVAITIGNSYWQNSNANPLMFTISLNRLMASFFDRSST
jgi:hypothetical protein